MVLSALYTGALCAQTSPQIETATNTSELPPWTLGDTIILIVLLLLLIFFSLAVYTSLLHLKKDIATTDSALKKILLTPIFLFLLALALCMLPLIALYWWFHPLILKNPASRRDGKNPPSP